MDTKLFTKKWKLKSIPVIADMNEIACRNILQIARIVNKPDATPIIDSRVTYFTQTNWHKIDWGSGNKQLDLDADIVKFLRATKLMLYNGQVITNPFKITTNFVKATCVAHGVNYYEFEQYRNIFNDVLATYGDWSTEFEDISWDYASELDMFELY